MLFVSVMGIMERQAGRWQFRCTRDHVIRLGANTADSAQ